jgi:hypothetical protein
MLCLAFITTYQNVDSCEANCATIYICQKWCTSDVNYQN